MSANSPIDFNTQEQDILGWREPLHISILVDEIRKQVVVKKLLNCSAQVKEESVDRDEATEYLVFLLFLAMILIQFFNSYENNCTKTRS